MLGTEAENILEDKYLNSKELEAKTLENINEEYNFDEIKDASDEASVTSSFLFSCGGENDEFIQACNFLSLNEDNKVCFVSRIRNRAKYMTNNSLSIHIETGNIFYKNFNTNKNFYSFLLARQDESKAIIPKRFLHHIQKVC